ncbi:MAG: hypothetical protein HOI95_26645, partial [Chromatiales bacterium]|nr:hypothetical protein [Chromatiales bacterium]
MQNELLATLTANVERADNLLAIGFRSSAALLFLDAVAHGVVTPRLFASIGNCYLGLGCFEAALYWYQRSFHEDPEAPEVRGLIGACLFECG